MTDVAIEQIPNEEAKTWTPKKWHPVYEEIVLLACLGKTNIELAEKFHYTTVHISNILRTPQAAILRRLVLDKLHEQTVSAIPERLEAIADKTVSRIQQAVDDDEMYARHPFAVIDRGLRVIQGLGYLKDSSERTTRVIFTTDAADSLREALEKSREAKLLNAPKIEDAEIVSE